MLTTRLVSAGTVGVLAFSLAACGGSSSSNAKGTSTVPSTTTSSTGSASATESSSATTSAPSAGSSDATPLTKAQLEKVVLQQAEVPTGWKLTDQGTDDAGGNTDDDEIANCTGVPSTGGDQAADVSHDFSGDSGQLHSEAVSFKHAASVEADKQLLKSPKLSSCFKQLIESEAKGDDTTNQVTLSNTKVTFVPASGGPAGYRGMLQGSLTVKGPAGTLQVFIDLYFAAKGQTEIDLGATSSGTEYPQTQSLALVQKMLSRVPS